MATAQRSHHGPSVLGTVALLAGILSIAIIAFIGVTAKRVMDQAAVDEARAAPAIVVFGAAEYAGRPSPVFRARLDHGYKLYEQGISELIITTGGAGLDPTYTEGGVGRDYLIRKGVPDSHLIAETQGGDTAHSAVRVATILRANGLGECVAVSDAYHIYRIKKLMAAHGIVAYGSPRRDSIPKSRWSRITACMREAASFLAWKLNLT